MSGPPYFGGPGKKGVGLLGCDDFLVGRHDRGVGSVLRLGHEFHRAGHEREEGVVLAHAHAVTRPELGAALAHDDRTGVDRFAAELLHAETAARGVAPVARGAAGFLVSHEVLLSLLVSRPITRPTCPSWGQRPSWG